MHKSASRMLVLGTLLLLSGCASGPTKTEFAHDRVVGRSDGLEKRPSWVKDTKSVWEEQGALLVLGVSEVPGDSRTQAAFMASDAAARGHLANKIEIQLTKIVESSNSGFNIEDQSLKSLIREVSQVRLKDLEVKDRYWEKAIITRSTGEEVLILRTYSLLSIPEKKLKQLMAEAIRQDRTPATPDSAQISDMSNRVEDLVRKNWAVDALVNPAE